MLAHLLRTVRFDLRFAHLDAYFPGSRSVKRPFSFDLVCAFSGYGKLARWRKVQSGTAQNC